MSPLLPMSPALVRLWRIAILVAAGDLVTKFAADRFWSSETLHVASWLSLTVVQNHGGAFGLTAGVYTWQLNLALTLAALVFVVPVAKDLTAVDSKAPVALGLIAGGALGNFVSLIAPPAGVGDFIALHWREGHALVLNAADMAAYAGLALILRTGFRIASTLVTQTGRLRPERVGSLYAAKADAKRQLHRLRIVPATEVVVAEWDKVLDLGVIRADAAEPEPRVVDITPRPHGVMLDDVSPRAMGDQRLRLDD